MKKTDKQLKIRKYVDLPPNANLNALLRFSEFTLDELKQKSRKKEVVAARQVLTAYLHGVCGWSSPKTGRFFGQDHATVLHSCQSFIDRWEFKDPLITSFISLARMSLDINPVLSSEKLKKMRRRRNRMYFAMMNEGMLEKSEINVKRRAHED